MTMGVAVFLGVVYFLIAWRRDVLKRRRWRRRWDRHGGAREINNAAVVAAIRASRRRGV
jgi:hypothetical protein